MALEFIEANFETEVLKSELPVLVDFWAEWCGPCRMMGPILEQLSQQYEGKVKIGKANVDDVPMLASTYGVQSIPTLILFKGGSVVGQRVGVSSPEDLTAWIDGLV